MKQHIFGRLHLVNDYSNASNSSMGASYVCFIEIETGTELWSEFLDHMAGIQAYENVHMRLYTKALCCTCFLS
jgi:hypothetical protein